MNQNLRPEHPRPDMERSHWFSLNGEWEFAETDDSTDESYLNGGDFPDRIIVPFCRESSLSGLGRRGFVLNVWYRRTFGLPAGWPSERTRLHIGACDWRTRVWVNGHLLGTHVGGNTPISFDVTGRLRPTGNTIIVHAFDDTRSGSQPGGKQSHLEESHGCHYTRTTGIWQPVWLEAVGSTYIKQFRVETDAEAGKVLLQAEIDGPADGLMLKAVATAEGKPAGEAEAQADWRNTRLVLPLTEKRLWSPEAPFLYDLKLQLLKDGRVIDEVGSYFGLRSVSIKGAAILINGKPVFQRLILDQGFYPDGIWTAPTDAALKADIELSEAAGFNGARLHQKVFEPRFLYWADRLGYLVWGEYPNWGMDYEDQAACLAMTNEWVDILARDRNHPSIIGWCPFNETPQTAPPIQESIVRLTRALDPSRPVLETSGWVHALSDPEILDGHDYDQNPVSFARRWNGAAAIAGNLSRYQRDRRPGRLPFMVSEFGGIGWKVGEEGWGYGSAPNTIEEFYVRYDGLCRALLDNRWMFGFCYTQLTDVEQEQNGLYTYERQPKFDMERIRTSTTRPAAYEQDPPLATEFDEPDWHVLVGAVPDTKEARPWQHTFNAPPEGWFEEAFDDSQWQTGPGGFGKKRHWDWATGTVWDTRDIWLRQEFHSDADTVPAAMIVTHYDNGTEFYINGRLVLELTGWNDRYEAFDITEAARAALKKGRNTIAVHCHQDEGEQFLDLAVLVQKPKS